MMTKEEILTTLLANKPKLVKKYFVKSIGLFGSYSHGNQSLDSDIDILIEFEKTPTFFIFLELENTLSNLLKRKVDLVTRKALKPQIGNRILREVIYI